MSESGVSEKSALRAVMLAQLRALTAAERVTRSEQICLLILSSEGWRVAERVLLFSPMRTEPDISPLADATKHDAKLVAVIPRTVRDESQLELPFVPDFVLVPGLAFSRDGHRLGRGGGFYDRLLAGRARHAVKVGVCFSLQLHDRIPTEAHDVTLDAVISDGLKRASLRTARPPLPHSED